MAIAGFGASVKIGTSTVISDTGEWSLDLEREMLDNTNFSSNGWGEYIAGLKNWSGSFGGSWNVQTDTAGQKALQDAWMNGTTVALKLFTNTTNNYSGTAYVSNVSVEAATDDLVTISFDFQGTGALAYA